MRTGHKRARQSNGQRRNPVAGGERTSWRREKARGFAMMMVVLAVGVSTAITYGFLRLQGTSLKVTENSRTRDWALHAAHAGISTALREMQSTTWGGVGSTTIRTVRSDSEGTSTVTVAYLSYSPKSDEGVPEDQGLRVLVRATGSWISATNSQKFVTRKVEAVMRLAPRGPKRPLVTEDYAFAEDVKANPTNYDTIQTYALFASGRDSGSTPTAAIGIGNRFEGRVWIREGLDLILDLDLSSSAWDNLFKGIGNRWVSSSGSRQVYHAHPFGREVNPSGPDLYFSTSSSNSDDYTNLKTSTSGIGTAIAGTAANPNGMATYRIFDGGPLYTSDVVTSPLSNVTLRPTVTNPLGIFRSTGSLTISSNVTIQGTLAVPGAVTLNGQEVVLSSLNWSGSQRLAEASTWARMPALVCTGNMTFNDSSRVVIDGAVVSGGMLKRAGVDFEFQNYSGLNLSGTATAVSVQQPWSEVQLYGISDLSDVTTSGSSALWLDLGNGGKWFPIVGKDSSAGKLTVAGEVNVSSACTCRIRANRKSFVTIQGPVMTVRVDLDSAPSWGISSWQWSNLVNSWTTANNVSPINFTTWLENPANVLLLGFSYPYWYYGLTLEPTFLMRNPNDIYYRWEPTMFEPYSDSGSGALHSGYRWHLLSWREI